MKWFKELASLFIWSYNTTVVYEVLILKTQVRFLVAPSYVNYL